MARTAGIAGAGLIGRVLALELARRGWRVTLFDRDTERGEKSCAWTGAGMLAPYCELETAEPEVAELGLRSSRLWPDLLKTLDCPVFYQQAGSLVVAHPSDRGELLRLREALRSRSRDPDALKDVAGPELAELEPQLAGRFPSGLFMPHEGQLDNRELLGALAATIHARGIAWNSGVEVQSLEKQRIKVSNDWKSFDWVFDCRGLGARSDVASLRGVRGELIYVSAPDVRLNRPVRLMHPRYPLYVVPRPENVFVVGATKVESDDLGPTTVRSALELLTAAYAVHPGFAEGRIIDLSVNCRPAFPDNKPRILSGDGITVINGLYRHGFLVSPALSLMACDVVEGKPTDDLARQFVGDLKGWEATCAQQPARQPA